MIAGRFIVTSLLNRTHNFSVCDYYIYLSSVMVENDGSQSGDYLYRRVWRSGSRVIKDGCEGTCCRPDLHQIGAALCSVTFTDAGQLTSSSEASVSNKTLLIGNLLLLALAASANTGPGICPNYVHNFT